MKITNLRMKQYHYKRVPQAQQAFAACDGCNRLKSGDRYKVQVGIKRHDVCTLCATCLSERGVEVEE